MPMQAHLCTIPPTTWLVLNLGVLVHSRTNDTASTFPLVLFGVACLFTSQTTTNTIPLYTLLSALDPGLTFVITRKPGTEAIIPQDAFLPGVGVEGLAAPSTEDTLVLRSDGASSHGRMGQVEVIFVVWDLSILLTSAELV